MPTMRARQHSTTIDPKWKDPQRRKVMPLPFLSDFVECGNNPRTLYPVDCIVPIHSSMLIVGRSHSHWTAYSFVDPLTDKEDRKYEHARGHGDELDDIDEEHWACPSEYHRQESFTDWEGWGPREYFLGVIKIRTQMANQEWRNTVTTLRDRVLARTRSTLSMTYSSQKSLEPHPATYHIGMSYHEDKLRHTQEWIAHTRIVLRELSSMLSETLATWEKFRDNDLPYLHDLLQDPGPKGDLRSLDHHMEDLRCYSQDLQDMLDRCDDMTKEV
jgi:hypothetical protein